jgi:N-acetylmuramoyl-L-alanine amidase
VNFIDTPSPNFNDRKGPIRFIVLHYTGMETGAMALERMCDAAAQVSAHYMIEEDGRVFRLVDEDKRAWHAGVSSWHGETDINSASIGIEIVNGGHDFGLPSFPEAQIEAVIDLVNAVMARHQIEPRDVIGHSDIAPGRKQDPGEKFPWLRLAEAGCALTIPDGTGVLGDPAELLQRIGYGSEPDLEDVVSAFQRRFRPMQISGQLDEETTALIRRVASTA